MSPASGISPSGFAWLGNPPLILYPFPGLPEQTFPPGHFRRGELFITGECQSEGRCCLLSLAREGAATARLLPFNAAERVMERNLLQRLDRYPRV